MREPFCIWASLRENLTLLHSNNKVAVHPPHLRSLISTVVIRYLESILILNSVAEQLGFILVKKLKKGFLATRHILCDM